MPIDIIDNFRLGSDIPIDVRYTANTYFDVSAYWYPGMQVFQYSDKQVWWYDGSIWQKWLNDFDAIDGGLGWASSPSEYVNGGTW